MPTPEPHTHPGMFGYGSNSSYPSAIQRRPVALHQLTDARREYLFKQYPELKYRVLENPETYGTLRTESSGPSVGGQPIDASKLVGLGDRLVENGFVAVGQMSPHDDTGMRLPGDDTTVDVRKTLQRFNIQVEGLQVQFDIGNDRTYEVRGSMTTPDTMTPNPNAGQAHQITAGSLAKSFLVWQTNRQSNVTKRELKKFLDKLWPDITGEELWKRTKVCWEVAQQLQANGWMQSEEAIRMKEFDLRAGSRKGITMRVAGG